MSAETRTVPGGAASSRTASSRAAAPPPGPLPGTRREALPGTRSCGAEGPRPGEALLEAADLEVVLPSGDGVGPWTGSLRAGEQVLLLGPSGSGKSTLLRALAGAIPSHQRGRVTGNLRVDGIDPIADGVLATSEVVGFLGQDPADGVCLPQVADDVALPLESRRVPPEEIGERVHRALDEAGIGPLAARAAATLSGGQLQRAGLAAALVARPRLLLLDEPTAMLDAEGVRAVREGVAAATRSGEVAVLLVEHRLDDWAGEHGVAGLPPRTLALDGSGRVLADGPTAEVLERHGAALREAGCHLPREVEERLGTRCGSGAGAPEPGTAQPGTTQPRAEGWFPAPDPEGRRTEPGAEGLAGRQRRAGLAAVAPSAAAPESAAPLLTVRAAALGHEDRPVLRGVDLAVRAGQLLAVVGRNGAGKSTLLGALSRLDPPLAGTLDGAAAGLVFQRPEAQFVADTVRDELAASGAAPERIEEMLDRLGLRGHSEASPFALSGGQQRRLSIGAMLLAGRPVLLADEPGYGLDGAASRTVLALLREAAAAGHGVVMTTHDLRSVASADAVAVIADGTLHGPMPPAVLLQDPALLRRAGLVAGPASGTDPASAPAPDLAAVAETDSAAVAERDPATVPEPDAVAVAETHRPGPSLSGPSRSGPSRSRPEAAPRAWLARRNPTVLLALLTGLSIVCIALTDPLPLLVLYLLLSAGAVLGCRLRPLRLLRAQLPFAIFASGIFLVNVLSRPGHEPWPGLPVRVTEEGIVLGAALALRALVIGLGALTVARATEPRRTLVSLQQHARLPARYAYALLAGHRLLEDLPRRWGTLTRAHRVRRPLREDGAVDRLRARHLLRCAFALLVDAVRSADRLAVALESRGLGDGPRTLWRPVPIGAADALLSLGIALVVAAVLVLA